MRSTEKISAIARAAGTEYTLLPIRRVGHRKIHRETAPSIAPLNRPRFINIHLSNREPAAPAATPGFTAASPGTLGGRSFSSAISIRDKVAHLSRWFTCAKSSPFAFTTHQFPVRTTNRDSGARFPRDAGTLLTTHVIWGGTVNRPRTHVTYRKQTIAYMQGRNFPVHFLFPIFRQNPIASGTPALLLLFANDVSCAASGVRHSRVEARALNPAKQTRLRARYLSRRFTRAKSSPFASTNHHSPITTHAFLPRGPRNAPRSGVATRHCQPSRNARKSHKTNGPVCLYPARPGACIFSLTFRSDEMQPRRKIRLRFGYRRAYNPRICPGAGSRKRARRRQGKRDKRVEQFPFAAKEAFREC